jgi:hypothetical protein
MSVCHCLDCRRRSGSAFAAQLRFASDGVAIHGPARTYAATGDQGSTATFLFCPTCGATIAYELDAMPGLTAIPYGAFLDASGLPPPVYSVYESRKPEWVEIVGDGIEHID